MEITADIALVLSILFLSMVLFIDGRLRMDLVAFVILGILCLTGLVTATEALAGFSNPAVVTVWSVFILSGGLARTGVAGFLGSMVLRIAGKGEVRLVLVIMLFAAFLSAFMNTVGVVALMLPVVMDIAHRVKLPPSKFLIPMAYSALLGGVTTLIGTPPNILISESLANFGWRPLGLFDFTPLGVIVTLAGILTIAFIGRPFLPSSGLSLASRDEDREVLRKTFLVEQRQFMLNLPKGSPLSGKSLVQSRIGSALSLNVLAIIRDGSPEYAPDPRTILKDGDQLLVYGAPGRLKEFKINNPLVLDTQKRQKSIDVMHLALGPGSPFIGKTLFQIDLRKRFGVNVLAIQRKGQSLQTSLDRIPLEADDRLLAQGSSQDLERLRRETDVVFLQNGAGQASGIEFLTGELRTARIPSDSILIGRTLAQSRLRDAFGVTVVGIERNASTLWPNPEEPLQAEDVLLIRGDSEELSMLWGLRDLTITTKIPPHFKALDSPDAGMMEVILSPRSHLAGKSLRELQFRERFGLSVLSIWQHGQALRSELRDHKLQFGDSYLLFGPRNKLKLLEKEQDFLIISGGAQAEPRTHKAGLAAVIMIVTLVAVLMGWLNLAIAMVLGATLMILVGCISMEEAYQNIDWKAVFHIACMLPLGTALENTGAAQFLAKSMISMIGPFGPYAIMIGLYVLTSIATQIIPTAALVVLMAPIAINTATHMGLSPYALTMAVAISASASFMSPIAHPANILVMGPGGYRFADYAKQGLLLTVVVFIMVVIFLPIFWPLQL